jgi:PAS domain S-box-containing protein
LSKDYKTDPASATNSFNNEKWFEAMIEYSSILIIRNLGDATITYANKAVCKTFGFPKEEIVGKKWLSEEEKDKIINNLGVANQNLKSFKTIVPYKLNNGNAKIIEWETSPIYDIDGNFTGEYQGWGFDITDKVTTEVELRKKENQLEIFFKQSLDGFFFMQIEEPVDVSQKANKDIAFEKLSTSLKVSKVNKAFLDQYGATESDVIGLTPLDFFLHNPSYGKDILRSIFDKQTLTLLTDERKLDGSQMWIEGNYYLMKDESDSIIGLFGIQREVTESQNLLIQIKRSEESYRKLFNSINDAIYVQDENGVFIDVNVGAEKMYGYTRDEFIGKTPEFLSAPGRNDFNKILTVLQNTFAGNGSSTFEFWGLKKDGEVFPKEVSTNKSFYFGKDVIITIARDISERKMSEEIIKESEARFRNVYENSPIGIFRTTVDGRIILANPALVKMLGYTSEKELAAINLEQEGFTSAFPRKDFKDMIFGEGRIVGYESIWKRKNGSEVYIRKNARPILDDNGEIAYYEGTVEDITEKFNSDVALRKSEEKLRETNLTKDKFFSIIAHDLRSPFQGLLGIASILTEEEDLAIEERIEYENKLFEGLKTQFNLLDDLLTWSRVQRGILEFIPSMNFLSRDAEEIFYVLKSNAEKKSIIVTFDIPGNISTLYDRNMMATIIRNLISNAIKFTNVGGSIRVSASQNKEEMIFSVTDSGIGISNEDMQKLFRIDTQFIRRGTFDEGGTGLGLILCKEFIDKHNGRIWIESEVGKGSTFSFSIPNSKVIEL